jgi:tRNA dimethylallyltransferase
MNRYNLVAVIGPTASGKTAFAAALASRVNGEIISADSRQVYRNMNLGTGKDYADYRVNGVEIPVHLVDIADPGYKYSVYEYKRDFIAAFNDIVARQKLPVLCGGSGMYIDAATGNYRLDEVPRNQDLRAELGSKSLEELTDILSAMKSLHNKTDVDTTEHALRAIEIARFCKDHPAVQQPVTDLQPLFIGIIYERGIERARITERLEARLKQGMIEEVRNLLDSGITAGELLYYGLEYRYITLYLTAQIDYHDMVARLNTSIHQFAKRQRTWFRKMEREGCRIHWLDGNMPMEEKIRITLEMLND